MFNHKSYINPGKICRNSMFVEAFLAFSLICLLGPLRTGETRLFRLAGKARDCAIGLFMWARNNH